MTRAPHQLRLDVRFYRVGISGFPEIKVQAGNRSAAKWQVFRLAREAGYFTRFSDFIARVVYAREVRR